MSTKAVAMRISKLEDRFGSAGGPSFVVVTACVTLPLDADTCMRILRECGYVATRGIVLVADNGKHLAASRKGALAIGMTTSTGWVF